jgi:alkanesulfonate monooxygenase SsuD/methylene tetrahydromethanopterin reductase-like flavin-dependent oxidoreductase (luciferase family)
VEFGTGRSNPYEQTGMGVDPRETRSLWDESIRMIPRIWEPGEFSWEGVNWNVPARNVLPKPYQKPHPPMWLACQQPESYQLAAEKGLGVLANNPYAPGILEQYVQAYRETVANCDPVGAFVNNQWSSNVFAYCGDNDREARDLCADSMKTFFGPDKPYIRGRIDAYEQLLAAWGEIPDHLQNDFTRWIRYSDEDTQNKAEEAGLNLDTGPNAARHAMQRLDPDTLVERGVIIGGNPETCIEGVRKYQEIGVDQIMMIMQTETISHERMMSSIEMFGKHVFPVIREEEKAKAATSARA